MPVLDFQSEDGEIISVHVKLDAPKEDFQIHTRVEDKKVFKRIYSSPLFSKDTDTGDGSKADFERTITGKNDTLGDVWKRSKDLSEQRAAKNGGVDPVLEKYYSDYEKKNRTKHADVLKKNRQESIERLRKDWGINIDFTK